MRPQRCRDRRVGRWVASALVVVFLCAPVSLAQETESMTAIELAVADALSPRVRTLTRSLYTYHYALRTRLGLPADGYVAPDDPLGAAYLDMKWRRFWDLTIPVHPNATVSGLYVGVDPVIPRAFGGVGDVWSLMQIVLEPGFRWVDVRRDPLAPRAGDAFSPAIRDRLAQEGCDVVYPESLLVSLESEACRRIAVASLRELDADGILYHFQRYRFEECGGADRPSGGIIILKPEALGTAQAKLLTKESSATDSAVADRQLIRQLFLRARSAGSRRKIPWEALDFGGREIEIDAWMRRHLFGCGDLPEDRLPTSPDSHTASY